MFYNLFDPYYWILIVPSLLLAIWAQMMVSSNFKKYSAVYNQRGYTGADAARMILDSNGLYHVRIERVSGNLTDHYDPKDEVIRLSDSVYGSTSVAAVGVAAHEAGHAVQHATGYDHAGKYESSVLMALDSEAVKLDRLPESDSWFTQSAYEANSELGQKMVDLALEDLYNKIK